MSLVWVAGAVIVGLACFVQGLAGFGIGLVALAFLPFLIDPATAVVLMTIYAAVFAAAIMIQLRADVRPREVWDLVVGTLVGTPVGVWVLATLPASVLARLIGLVLIGAALLEFRGLYPRRLVGRGWAVGTGVVAGIFGGAVGMPGPPAILYGATQPWSPRVFKANFQAFLFVNQVVVLVGYWWANLLSREVGRLALAFAVPAVIGIGTGMLLFERVDPAHFRRLVFVIIAVSGLVLVVRG